MKKKPRARATYHHGDLRAALIQAADVISPKGASRRSRFGRPLNAPVYLQELRHTTSEARKGFSPKLRF